MSEAFQPLTKSQLPGIILVVAVAVVSAAALAFVAARVLCMATRSSLSNSRKPSREYIFFRTQLGLYAACLLASNFLDSIAGVIAGSFVARQGVREGPVCTAQGVLMQIGNFATAYFTVVIAVHTFASLVLRFRRKLWHGASVMVMGWISSILIGVIPLAASGASGPIYGNDGFACGVRRVYPVPQLLFHLLPIFFASLISAILYSLIFLVLRGTLVFQDGFKLNLDPHHRWSGHVGTNEGYHRFIGAIARSMLWYPFAYIVLLLPYSITRLMDISGFTVSFGTNVFAYTCIFVLGLVNVLLLYGTFRVLDPALSPSHSPDLESFHSKEKPLSSPTGVPPSAVTATMPAKSFPPPRSQAGSIGSYRFPSTSARGLTHERTPSNRPLIAPRMGIHGYTESTDSVQSAASAHSLQRAITPAAELSLQLAAPPESAVQRGSLLRPLHLATDGRISPQAYRGLPPPPRAPTRQPAPSPAFASWETNSAQQRIASPTMNIVSYPSLTAVSVQVVPPPPAAHYATSPSDYGSDSEIALSPRVVPSYVRGLPDRSSGEMSAQPSRQPIRYRR